MKKLICSALLFASLGAFAQELPEVNKFTENQKRLSEIPQRLEEAVAAENYQEAANLQEEMKIRKKIEVATSNEEYSRVVELEKELANCECRPKPVRECVEEKEKDIRVQKKERSYGPKKHSFYLDFAPLGFVNSSYEGYPNGYYPYYDYTNEVSYYQEPTKQTDFSALAGLRLGSSIFFGDMTKDFKVGLDISYLSISVGARDFDIFSLDPSIYVSIARPGVIMTKFFKNNNGIDMKVNTGVMLGASSGLGFVGGIGFNAGTSVKYWKKRFGVGLEYQYGYIPDGTTNINQLAVTVGLRF